jgi:hypothetical protein
MSHGFGIGACVMFYQFLEHFLEIVAALAFVREAFKLLHPGLVAALQPRTTSRNRRQIFWTVAGFIGLLVIVVIVAHWLMSPLRQIPPTMVSNTRMPCGRSLSPSMMIPTWVGRDQCQQMRRNGGHGHHAATSPAPTKGRKEQPYLAPPSGLARCPSWWHFHPTAEPFRNPRADGIS